MFSKKKMKIGIDISQIAHVGGVSNYTYQLSKNLSKLSEIDLVFFYSSLRRPFNKDLKNVRSFKIPPTLLEILFNYYRVFPIERFIDHVDIFHSSDWTQPRSSAIKVTTYHDLVPLKYPEWSSPSIIKVHKRRIKLVEKEIDGVIAVSESTKNDLIDHTTIPENKITVIYEGVDETFGPRSEAEVCLEGWVRF